jgi:hypothetical protein
MSALWVAMVCQPGVPEIRGPDVQFHGRRISESLPNDPQYAPVCLCGMLFQPAGYHPGRRPLSPDQHSFLDAWKRAQEYQLQQIEAEERIEEQLRAAPNPEYLKQLAARVESAEQLINQLAAELKGRQLKSLRKRP